MSQCLTILRNIYNGTCALSYRAAPSTSASLIKPIPAFKRYGFAWISLLISKRDKAKRKSIAEAHKKHLKQPGQKLRIWQSRLLIITVKTHIHVYSKSIWDAGIGPCGNQDTFEVHCMGLGTIGPLTYMPTNPPTIPDNKNRKPFEYLNEAHT